MKKKVKKQLKTDEFANLMNKLWDFVRSNLREIKIGAVAVLVIVLIFVGIKTIQGIGAKKQSDVLGQVLALEEQLAENPEKLAELEALGGSGRFARLAYIKAAIYSFENGNSAKALDLLRKFPSGRKDLVYYQAQDLLGQIFHELGQYDDALAVFEGMERAQPKDYAMDIVLYRKAQVLAARNDIDLAIETYTKLQADFPGSYYGYEASSEIQKLEEKK